MADLVSVGALRLPFTILYEVIKEVVIKTPIFRSLIEELKMKMEDLKPLIDEMDRYHKVLNRPENELREFKLQMEKGPELIRKCANISYLKSYKKYKFSHQLLELQNSLQNLLVILQWQQARDNMKESLEEVKIKVGTIFQKIDQKCGVQNQIDSEVPVPPRVIVGLYVPLRDLKMKLLWDPEVSMLVLTAPGGCGKTTLATMFCQDEDVKGTFKKNIFFFTVSEDSNFSLIVQGLCQRKSTDVPSFQDEATAIKWLRKFLKEEGEAPVLLVLDDVWAEYLLEKFHEVKMPNFKILVTSRLQFRGYGSLYHLQSLNDTDAMTLLRHSASLGDGSITYEWNKLAGKIVEHCKGHPFAIDVVGKSLRGKSFESWCKREMELSKSGSIVDAETDVFLCLKSSLDALDEKEAIIKECFVDLASFPEGQRIPVVVLIDMWAELYEELNEDFLAYTILHELTTRSLADLVVSRNKDAEDDDFYCEQFLTQNNLLRQLAIYQTKQDPNGKRLFLARGRDNLPKFLTERKHPPIKPRLVSISSDGVFSKNWNNIQLAEVVVLILNFNTENYVLPEFVEKMENLKVLIVTNQGSLPAELSNFRLLESLPNLKRIRLEHVSITSITERPIQLKSLKKISLFKCSIGQAFSNHSFHISDAFPYLEEMNIEYSSDLVELPDKICNLVWLKKLCITNCHKLSALPDDIGKLVRLEVLRLRACAGLVKLPTSIKNLDKLNLLDISNCLCIVELPEDIGQLSSLRKIDMRWCLSLQELPLSVLDLEKLEEAIYDEEKEELWEPFLARLNNTEVRVVKEEFNLNWFHNPTLLTVHARPAVAEGSPILEGPPLIVGLDLPLDDLKRKFLKEGVSRLVLTGHGGVGKTTLARKFFEDEHVKGMFKKNMFFVVASNKPSLEVIVRELYQQKEEAVPNNIRNYGVAIQSLENFLEEAGQDHLLFVLDDVWSQKFLLDHFDKFKMPNYKFLVTSRYSLESFGEAYPIQYLDRENTMTLFCDCLGENINIPEEVKEKIRTICKGFPLIIKVFARSICKQPMGNWQKRVMKWSGAVVSDINTEVLICLQKSLEPLDKITKNCFMDLGSFPEDQKISAAALIDMWSELYPELTDDAKCIEMLYKLSRRSLADLEYTRKERIGRDGYYSEHFVTLHDKIRQLAIYEARREPIEQTQRLSITNTSSDLPIGQEHEEDPNPVLQPLKARLLSISSDGAYSMKWNTVHLPEVEVLLLNFESSNYGLPKFMKRVSRLKVLIVTNNGCDSAELSNFQLLCSLQELKRIRLESISTPSITKNLTQLKSLEKITLSWCDEIYKGFSSSSIQISHAFPKLVELNIDNCSDLEELPAELCDLVTLKKLSVTECYDLRTIPEAIGQLVNLELLRLRRCKELRELPASLESLKKLYFLDIADCVSMKELPQNIGALSSLTKLDMRQCHGLVKLPPIATVYKLTQLREVICDEGKKKLWDRYLCFMENLKVITLDPKSDRGS